MPRLATWRLTACLTLRLPLSIESLLPRTSALGCWAGSTVLTGVLSSGLEMGIAGWSIVPGANAGAPLAAGRLLIDNGDIQNVESFADFSLWVSRIRHG